jgi:AcrR family transcriptional regulator
VGIGTLYRHFPDRPTLLRAVAEDVLALSVAEARSALDEEPTAFDALRRYLRGALDIGVAVMNHIHQAMDFDGPLQALSDASASVAQQLIALAQGEGTLRPDAEFGDVRLALVRFSRPIGGALPADLDGPLALRHLEIYIDGLRAGGASGLDGEPALSLARLRAIRGRSEAAGP